MERPHFSVTWDKYHSSMCAGLSVLQQNGELVDLTLAADGRLIKVHQVVLGIASSYMKELILSANCKHPVIFMNNVSYKTLCSILEYVYMGEVSIEEAKLEEFLNTAKTLRINGLDMWQNNDNDEHPNVQVMESTPDVTSNVFKKYRIDIVDNKTTKLTEEVQLPVFAKNIQVKRDHPSGLSPALDLKKSKMSPKTSSTPNKPSLSQTSSSDDATQPGTDNFHHDFGPSHHDDQSDEEPLFTKTVCEDNNELDVPKADLKFTLSNMGGLQLILNRYMYSLRHYRKEHGSVRKWQCVDHRHRHCPAIAITDNDMVIRRKKLHNHPYHDKRILIKIEKKAVFSTIRTAENNVELILAR